MKRLACPSNLTRCWLQSITDRMRIAPLSVAVVRPWASSVIAQQPQPTRPDPRLTPGDVFDVTAADICTPGYSKRVRNVPSAVKAQVYREYGITEHRAGDYEVDHRAT